MTIPFRYSLGFCHMVLDMIKVSKKTFHQVLNAHMDSLQWIDSSALAVERKLGEVTRWEMIMISI